MLEAKAKVARSKAELLAVLRQHTDAVEAACARHGAHNLRVFGPDFDGDEWSVAVLADIDEGIDYSDLELASLEIAETTGYRVVIDPSSVVGQLPDGHLVHEATAL